MKRSFITFILATLFAAAPVLAAAQIESEPLDNAAIVMMADEDCSDCVDCDEQTGMMDCAKACQASGSSGNSLAISGQRSTDVFRPVTAGFAADADDRMSGVLAASDIPPPRV